MEALSVETCTWVGVPLTPPLRSGCYSLYVVASGNSLIFLSFDFSHTVDSDLHSDPHSARPQAAAPLDPAQSHFSLLQLYYMGTLAKDRQLKTHWMWIPPFFSRYPWLSALSHCPSRPLGLLSLPSPTARAPPEREIYTRLGVGSPPIISQSSDPPPPPLPPLGLHSHAFECLRS